MKEKQLVFTNNYIKLVIAIIKKISIKEGNILINLVKMSPSEFQSYLVYAIKNYATEHVKAGNWKEKDAIAKATDVYEKLLPDGERTPNQEFFTIWDGNQEVGMIWFGKKADKKGYIYDINIWEDYQGRGYGKQAMNEIENVAKVLGIKNIELHVFGHNKAARNLYEKLGYVEVSIVMSKTL